MFLAPLTAFLSAMVGISANVPISDCEIKETLKSMLNDYDRRLRPNYSGPPVDVVADATVLAISNIDEVRMMYTLDMFFRQRWDDHRLKHKLNETMTLIVGAKHPADFIWVPDTVFIDCVTSSMHHVIVNNHKIDISPNGSVFWGTRVTVSPSCPLNLKAYPMDRQVCPLKIVSYAYTSRHVKYRWQKYPGIKFLSTAMPHFILEDYETHEEEIDYIAGNYTVLKAKFYFRRLMGFAIMQIYTPTICVVIVSWISLWVRRNAVAARVALCITTLLTISTVWSSTNSRLPRVNYVKAIDIFMMMSFACIILTLLEYTFVLNCYGILKRFKQRREMLVESHEVKHLINGGKKLSRLSSTDATWTVHRDDSKGYQLKANNLDENIAVTNNADESEYELVADTIDSRARIVFPLAYIVFLLTYFSVYLKA